MNTNKGFIWLFWAICFLVVVLTIWGGEAIVYRTLNFYNQSQNSILKIHNNNSIDSSTTTQEVIHSKPQNTPDSNTPDSNTLDGKTTAGKNTQHIIEQINVQKTIKTPTPLVVAQPENPSANIDVLSDSGVIFYTNLEREKKGLLPLRQKSLLMQVATAKLSHMFTKQYFAHNAPSGENVAYWVDSIGYNYLTVGENLAMGSFQDSKDMVTAWMNSPGHRANILKEGYMDIGVAVRQGKFKSDTVWLGVQVFGTAMEECPIIDKTLKQKINTYNTLLDETEIALKEIKTLLSEEQTVNPENHVIYLNLIEQYNKLVGTYNKLAAELKSMINDYNNQVTVFNVCIVSKQNGN